MNSLDKRAAAAALYREIHLEIQEVSAELNYSAATTWCDDCPLRDHDCDSYDDLYGERRIADHCCKEDGSFSKGEDSYLAELGKLKDSLALFAGEDMIAQAMTTISDK